MELSLCRPRDYRVKRGQTLEGIARAFRLPPRVLAAYNELKNDPQEGQVLRLPQETGDLYLVRGGESKSLLCGSPARFFGKNRTNCLFPGQTVLLG